jgi:hypothetical protein
MQKKLIAVRCDPEIVVKKVIGRILRSADPEGATRKRQFF